jgi:NAD(P)-dependent dehydrogenase (short-subunit alcohol dehydrogenase family)
MRASRTAGAIVLVSTMQAVSVWSGSTAYASQKAALIQAARVLATECKGKANIRVNVVCPGVNQAGMAEASIASGKYERYLKKRGYFAVWESRMWHARFGSFCNRITM